MVNLNNSSNNNSGTSNRDRSRSAKRETKRTEQGKVSCSVRHHDDDDIDEERNDRENRKKSQLPKSSKVTIVRKDPWNVQSSLRKYRRSKITSERKILREDFSKVSGIVSIASKEDLARVGDIEADVASSSRTQSGTQPAKWGSKRRKAKDTESIDSRGFPF
ncbi:uncharacterized protein LOC114873155 isoform X1 [Osmia bicornis bicornis]|uniref:uncharacterized protein LOC114873155 isoform X1 n=1 Tax=Osmia bicornis bicornis TaxID=1437191 RepID=UPI001EAF8B0A|nr:uncharacterized protein LOC114873155 isoform X1 [Osmia bicornis bicornis]